VIDVANRFIKFDDTLQRSERGPGRCGLMATQPADFWKVCLLCKRLEDGKFRWRRLQDGVVRLSTAQLSARLEGLDWSRVHARRVTRPQAVQ
jgi:transposase